MLFMLLLIILLFCNKRAGRMAWRYTRSPRSSLAWVGISNQLQTVIPVLHRQGDSSMCVPYLGWTLNGRPVCQHLFDPSIHWDHTLCRVTVLPKQSPGLLDTILDGSPRRRSIIPASWYSFCQPRKDHRLSQPQPLDLESKCHLI